MAALHGSVDILDDDTGNLEEEHEFETFAQEFIDLDDWHEVTTDRKVTFSEHQEPPLMNIMNITGIVSNDESIGTIPWSPVKKLPAKPKQPPSRPTPSNKSQLSLSQELVHRSSKLHLEIFLIIQFKPKLVQRLTCLTVKPNLTTKNLLLIALKLLPLLPYRPRSTS